MVSTVNLLNDRLTENFRLDEFVCHSDNDSMLITPEFLRFVQMLQEFRDWYNRPVNVNSGYRTVWFNNTLENSSPTSQHLKALAIDVSFPREPMTDARKQEFLDNVRTKWFKLCDEYGVTGGNGFYDWGFHIDSGDTEVRRTWDLRS